MLVFLFFLLTNHLIGQYLPSFSVELDSSNYQLGDQRLHHIPSELGSSPTPMMSWQVATVDNGGSFGTAFDNSSVMKCNCTADLGSSPSPMMSWQVATVDNGGSFETTFKVTIDESDLFQNFFLSFYFVMQSGIISTISLVGLCRIHRTIPWRKRQRLHLDGVFYLVNLLPALPTTMCFIAAVILFFTFAYKFTFEKKSNHCRPRHYSLIQKCQSRCYQSVKDMAKVGAGVLCIPTGELFLDTIRQFICSFC